MKAIFSAVLLLISVMPTLASNQSQEYITGYEKGISDTQNKIVALCGGPGHFRIGFLTYKCEQLFIVE